jgi:hypothetical protein
MGNRSWSYSGTAMVGGFLARWVQGEHGETSSEGVTRVVYCVLSRTTLGVNTSYWAPRLLLPFP